MKGGKAGDGWMDNGRTSPPTLSPSSLPPYLPPSLSPSPSRSPPDIGRAQEVQASSKTWSILSGRLASSRTTSCIKLKVMGTGRIQAKPEFTK